MDVFPTVFDRFADQVLPSALTDGALLRIRSVARFERIGRETTAPVPENVSVLIFMAKGAAKLVAHTASGREQVLGFYFPRDLLLLPANAAHSSALRGLTDCSLLIMPHRALREIALVEPALASRLLDATEISLARCRDKAVTLGRKSAPERMAGFLLSMIDRVGIERDGGISLELPMSRRDIADSIGLTIETVSRQITLLREESLITTCGRTQIILHDRAALEHRAGFIS